MRLQETLSEGELLISDGEYTRHFDQELLDEQDKCLPNCLTRIYPVTEKESILTGMTDDTSIELKLTQDAMYFLQVREELTMTLDDLVGNIGGDAGCILGCVLCYRV